MLLNFLEENCWILWKQTIYVWHLWKDICRSIVQPQNWVCLKFLPFFFLTSIWSKDIRQTVVSSAEVLYYTKETPNHALQNDLSIYLVGYNRTWRNDVRLISIMRQQGKDSSYPEDTGVYPLQNCTIFNRYLLGILVLGGWVVCFFSFPSCAKLIWHKCWYQTHHHNKSEHGHTTCTSCLW